jgi:hypothetical protein
MIAAGPALKRQKEYVLGDVIASSGLRDNGGQDFQCVCPARGGHRIGVNDRVHWTARVNSRHRDVGRLKAGQHALAVWRN